MTTAARLADWFLTAAERGNPATRLDARRGDGLAWAMVGSDNFNRRSWTHDSELSVAVWDSARAAGGAGRYPRDLRLALAAEHLDDDLADATEPAAVFRRFARSAAVLQAWHDGGCLGPRPPGRLRPLDDVPLTSLTRLWAEPLYRTIYDPDGRPRGWRRRERY